MRHRALEAFLLFHRQDPSRRCRTLCSRIATFMTSISNGAEVWISVVSSSLLDEHRCEITAPVSKQSPSITPTYGRKYPTGNLASHFPSTFISSRLNSRARRDRQNRKCTTGFGKFFRQRIDADSNLTIIHACSSDFHRQHNRLDKPGSTDTA